MNAMKILGIACVLLLVAPSAASACTIPIRSIGPIKVTKRQLQRPGHRTTTRTAWKVDSTWVSVVPELSQFVKVTGIGKRHGVTYPGQRNLSIDARGPDDTKWIYFDDNDPLTAACTMVGQIEWQRPQVRVVETAREVRISALVQRTVGDRTGCTYGFEHGVAECPNLTRTIIRLARPVGKRPVVFEQFALEANVAT